MKIAVSVIVVLCVISMAMAKPTDGEEHQMETRGLRDILGKIKHYLDSDITFPLYATILHGIGLFTQGNPYDPFTVNNVNLGKYITIAFSALFAFCFFCKIYFAFTSH